MPLSQMHGSSAHSAEALATSDLDALQWWSWLFAGHSQALWKVVSGAPPQRAQVTSISTPACASLTLGQEAPHKTERKVEATSALPFFRSLRKRRLALSRSGWVSPSPAPFSWLAACLQAFSPTALASSSLSSCQSRPLLSSSASSALNSKSLSVNHCQGPSGDQPTSRSVAIVAPRMPLIPRHRSLASFPLISPRVLLQAPFDFLLASGPE